MNLIPADELEGANIAPVSIPIANVKPLAEIVEQLVQEVKDRNAAGIAAPQVGIMQQIAVMRLESGEFLPMINPRYFPAGSLQASVEGCLSYPNERYIVRRYKHITARFYTMKIGGRDFELVQKYRLSGMDCTVFQHETDHCRGLTIALKGKAWGPKPKIPGVDK